MLIAYWIVAVILGVVVLGAGLLKIIRNKEQLTAMGMGWVQDAADWQVKAIGALEVVAVVGLIAPMASGIAPVLSPIAAIGIAIMQAVAFVVHARRKDPRNFMLLNMAVFALAGAAAVLGFFALAGY